VVSGPGVVLLDDAAAVIRAAVVVMVVMVLAEVGPVEELVQRPTRFEAGLKGGIELFGVAKQGSE
jgi:hypothetical protein